MKSLNYHLYDEIAKGLDYARAIAFSILVKQHDLVSSTIKGCTVNKLHEMTGLHSNTIKKHLLKLAEMGLIDELPNGSIVFKSLSNKHENRNMPPIDFDHFKTLTEIEYAVYTVAIMERLKRMKYTEEKCKARFNPTKDDDFEAARKYCRKHNITKPFLDNGLSYDGIAEGLNISSGTAETIIEFAVKHNFLKKHNRQIQVPNWNVMKKIPNKAAFLETVGAHFCTNNNVYKVLANTYTIIDPELHTYEVDTTDNNVELPKWQTAENLLHKNTLEKQNEKKKSAKKSKTHSAKAEKEEIQPCPTVENCENLGRNIKNRVLDDIFTTQSLVSLLPVPSCQEQHYPHGNISS